jgi:integrase
MLKTHPLIPLLEKFIRRNGNKKRRKANGAIISQNTLMNYQMFLKMLLVFEKETNFELQLYEINRATEREKKKVQKYWNSFYNNFTDFLYDKQNYTDNYVGQNIKLLKAFLNWLSNDMGMQIGNYYKKFYVPTEDIAIVVLEPEMLNYLIYDKDLENRLSEKLKTAKDLFVFGCTVGLRYSDLKRLSSHNLELINHRHYLVTRSQKTQTLTRIMLPDYAVEIIKKYKNQTVKNLLPFPVLFAFNFEIKQLIEEAG